MKKIAEIFNTFFSEAAEKLDISENEYLLNSTTQLSDPVDKALSKSQFHPIILKIKDKVSNSSFKFQSISIEDVQTEIKLLNCNKSTFYNDIPAKNPKENIDIVSPILHSIINKSIAEN